MTENTNSKNNIGIFGGSFDPVHNGHLIIASYAIEHFELDKLFVVPAYIPPHKKDTVASYEKRIQWLNKAFENSDKIEIDDFERRNSGISYTVKTVKYFGEKFSTKPFLIIGEDSYNDLENWYKYKEILNSTILCVYPRRIHSNKTDRPSQESVIFFDAPLIGISSSLIRKRISIKKSVLGMIPCMISKEVVEFYEKNL
ncbi:MAG: nicotinate (nicotinamide) nucleotide adenylyltransferase [Kosmotoga sp.]|nr:MAG: nicotinate (nicotinamide) nucleotide adenylyltransferase [Kosmotoga sp.]